LSPASALAEGTRTIAADRGRPLYEFVRATGLRAVVLGLSKDPNAKVTVLLVAGSGRPVFAVKAPTSDAAARAVEREARLLADARLRAAHVAVETVPRVVGTVDFDGRPALVTTAVPGTPMTASYLAWRHTAGAGRVAADFAAAGRWLAALQRQTAAAGAPLDMDAGVAARLASRFDGEPRLGDVLARLEEIHARLREHATPRTVVHGDLWLGNVLLERGRVSGVVDWEAGAGSGQPVRDVVRFANMYALFLDRRTRAGRRVRGHVGLRAGADGAGLAFALEGAGWFPEHFRRFVGDGLARLGVPPAAWSDAVLAGVAEVAALTDDDGFARAHLALLHRLVSKPPYRKEVR
jgi:aminoglycoside phosphotransferase (APT) family kinase protein